MTPTPEQIAKLPKWAQDHIKSLSRERDTALSELNRWTADQKESKWRIDEFVCTGPGPSTKTRYIQTDDVTITHAGVELRISTHQDKWIDVKWGTPRYTMGDVALIPQSFCHAHLVSKENMR